MIKPTWIVCERSARWAPALRMIVANPPNGGMNLTICETRSLAELDRQIEETPSAFVFLEVSAENLAPVLDRFGSATRSGVHRQVVALVERRLADYHNLLREAGAIDVICSPRELHHAVRLVLQHAQTQSRMQLSSGRQSIKDWAMSLLPWQAVS
jgi:hypothetical protein